MSATAGIPGPGDATTSASVPSEGPASPLAAPGRRLLELDALRAVAVLLVLGRHVTPPRGAPEFLHVWYRGGWVGVDLFFVLSGFLVSGLLFKELQSHGSIRAGAFLLRRGLKIYPAFYAFMAITLADPMINGRLPPLKSILYELLFVQSYVYGIWNHTWSLAVEEHFYIGIALLFTVFARTRWTTLGRRVPALFLLVAAASLALRLWNAGRPYDHWTHLFPTHLRTDALAFGVLVSYYWNCHHERFVAACRPLRWALVPLGIALLAPAFLYPVEETPFIYTFGLTLFYVGSGAILIGVLVAELPITRALRGLAFVGSHSYSIYLWHMPVIDWFTPPVSDSWPLARLAVAVAGSVIVGIVAARLIELPVLRFRDRLLPSRADKRA